MKISHWKIFQDRRYDECKTSSFSIYAQGVDVNLTLVVIVTSCEAKGISEGARAQTQVTLMRNKLAASHASFSLSLFLACTSECMSVCVSLFAARIDKCASICQGRVSRSLNSAAHVLTTQERQTTEAGTAVALENYFNVTSLSIFFFY